jgi:hypothetical protein
VEPLSILLLIVGFTAGLMLWSRIANTAFAIVSTITKSEVAKQPTSTVTPPLRALLWFCGAVCLWLMIFGGLCVHFSLGGSSTVGWAWFFGGMTGTPAFVSVNVAMALRRHRRESAARGRQTASAVVPGGVSYTYRFIFDEAYIRTMIERYYRQRPLILRPVWQLALLGVLMTIWFSVFPIGDSPIPFVLMMSSVYALFAIGALAALRTMVYQKFRYTSYFGKTSIHALSDEGLSTSGPGRAHLVDWPMLQSAVRYSDGILLLRRGVICWLPDAALEGATGTEVAQLVNSKIRLRDMA